MHAQKTLVPVSQLGFTRFALREQFFDMASVGKESVRAAFRKFHPHITYIENKKRGGGGGLDAKLVCVRKTISKIYFTDKPQVHRMTQNDVTCTRCP